MVKSIGKFQEYLGQLQLPLVEVKGVGSNSRNQYSRKPPTLKMMKNSRVMGESLLVKGVGV